MFVIAISGPVCAGKSTLAKGLATARGVRVLTTRLLIARLLDRRPDELTRGELQTAGDELDRERGGAWVAEEIGELLVERPGLVVIDAVRNADQLAAVRDVAATFHVHLSADEATLAARYAERSRSNPQLEFPNFESLRANPTEAQVEELVELADLTIDTSRAKPQTRRWIQRWLNSVRAKKKRHSAERVRWRGPSMMRPRATENSGGLQPSASRLQPESAPVRQRFRSAR